MKKKKVENTMSHTTVGKTNAAKFFCNNFFFFFMTSIKFLKNKILANAKIKKCKIKFEDAVLDTYFLNKYRSNVIWQY